MAKAFISAGKRTAGHGETLAKLGYNVESGAEGINVEVSGFVTGPIKVSDLAGIASRKEAITYSTVIEFSDGKKLHGVFACGRLGALSCLVMRSVDADAKKAAEKSTKKATEGDSLLAQLLA